MRLEDASKELRVLGDSLFQFVEKLAGSRPEHRKSGDWYKVASDARAFMYFKFVGTRARKRLPHSLMINTEWNDSLAGENVERGNNWWGKPSADFIAVAGRSADLNLAKDFIRRAFKINGQ